MAWCGVVWFGVVWVGVGVVWRGVVWCDVVWCGVVWEWHVVVCGGEGHLKHRPGTWSTARVEEHFGSAIWRACHWVRATIHVKWRLGARVVAAAIVLTSDPDPHTVRRQGTFLLVTEAYGRSLHHTVDWHILSWVQYDTIFVSWCHQAAPPRQDRGSSPRPGRRRRAACGLCRRSNRWRL